MSLPAKLSDPTIRHRLGLLQSNDPFSLFRDEMDDVFSQFFPSILRTGDQGSTTGLALRADMTETKDAISVTVDVPGIEEKNIDVQFADNILTISGHRDEESEEKDTNFHMIERSYGAFQRRFVLPCEIDSDKIDAKLKKGVLKIKLPKSAKAKANGRKIAITAS